MYAMMWLVINPPHEFVGTVAYFEISMHGHS